jgi:hypothetical protein
VIGQKIRYEEVTMNKQSSKISIIATPVMVICGLLVSGASARADSDEEACSNRTLRGEYGFAVEGLILPAPGVAVPIRGVHMTHFDGHGNLRQVDWILVNGNPISDATPVTGTYNVNADCSGTINLLPSNGEFVNLRIVVVKDGKEVHTVVWPPFDGPGRTVTSVGLKVD